MEFLMTTVAPKTKMLRYSPHKGALMLSISINHPDVEEFITKKQDLTKVTGANISVKVTDEFMKAVIEDRDYMLRFPIDLDIDKVLEENKNMDHPMNELQEYTYSGGTAYLKMINAKELWDTLMKCAYSTAEPGILFETAMHNFSPDGVYEGFRMVSTNPCQPEWATVLTPQGIRLFRDINVGDIIWSSEGWTEIIRKESSGKKEVYKYKTLYGEFIGTENHRIISNGEKIEVKDAKTIDTLAGNGSIKSSENLESKDIISGMLFGKYKERVIFPTEDNEGELLLDFEINEDKDLLVYSEPSEMLKSEITYKTLKKIPVEIEQGNLLKVRGFLKGLFSIASEIKEQSIQLQFKTEEVAKQVQLMLSSIGIRSKLLIKVAGSDDKRLDIIDDLNLFYHKVGFIQRDKMKVLSELVDNLKSSSDNLFSEPIHTKEFISEEEVFNITVSNSTHTYWTGGLNVANCGQ